MPSSKKTEKFHVDVSEIVKKMTSAQIDTQIEKQSYVTYAQYKKNMLPKKREFGVLAPVGGESVKSFLENHFQNVVIKKSFKEGQIDLVVFMGGADVNPEFYNEKVGKFTQVDRQRDNQERDIFFEAQNYGIPMLGICRGSQLLSVLNGHSLIQHVTGHAIGNFHDITIVEKDGKEIILPITSTHHQMMRLTKGGTPFSLIGYSTKFRSNVYLNGEDQNISVDKDFLEPEIVKFHNTNSLAIQGHPEFTHCPKETRDYLLNLISRQLNLSRYEKQT